MTRFTSQALRDEQVRLENQETMVSQFILWNKQNDCCLNLVDNKNRVWSLYQINSVSKENEKQYLGVAKKFYNRSKRIADKENLTMYSY